MRASSFNEYAEKALNTIKGLLATGQAVLAEQNIDQRSALRGFIGGVLQFEDGSELHFREFVDTSLPEPRVMYAYHYQDANDDLVFVTTMPRISQHCLRLITSIRGQPSMLRRRRPSRW